MTPQALDAGVGVDRGRLAALTAREAEAFAAARPRSRELAERARGSLLGGVPMTWMMRWAGPYPLFLAEAHGARVVDVDGHEYVDLCLGDTGAMAGHSPEPVVRAVAERAAAGITAMLPTEDAAWAGEELARRFGLPLWQFTLSATDANRFAIRMCRAVTAGRRSSSSTAATTARSTRRSRRCAGTAPSASGPATSARPSTRR